MVARGLSRSRGQAAEWIKSGRVSVDGRVVVKPAARVVAESSISVDAGASRFVGRGADKLVGALDEFRIDVTDRRALDAGASTGGFTEVLLARGAAHVTAVDVGHSQLAEHLRDDARVLNVEGTNLRDLRSMWQWPPVDVVTADLSFISLTLVVAELQGVVADGADLVVLVKPQFEAGRAALDSRGVVTSPHDRAAAVQRVAAASLAAGLTAVQVAPCAITGSAGNQEYFLHLVAGAPRPGVHAVSLDAIGDRVLQDGGDRIRASRHTQGVGAQRRNA